MAFVPLYDVRTVGDGGMRTGDAREISQVRDRDDVLVRWLNHGNPAMYNNETVVWLATVPTGIEKVIWAGEGPGGTCESAASIPIG